MTHFHWWGAGGLGRVRREAAIVPGIQAIDP